MNINIIDVSDTHVNSHVGLLPPKVQLDDGGVKEYNVVQKFIWESWIDFWQRVNGLRGYKIGVFKGDILDLDPGQRISNNRTDIIKMALAAYEPALDILDTKFVVRGTEYHAGIAAELEENFAKYIGAKQHPETGNYAWWRLPMNINGILLDFAHHTNIGSLPWTETNSLIRLIYQTILECEHDNTPVPNIISRGHVHRHVDTYNIHPRIRAYTTNSWQHKTAYGHKRATDKSVTYGGSIITITDNKYDIEHVTYHAKKDYIWKLELN